MHDGPTRDGLAGLSLPEVVPRETWLRARLDLLAREKELTRERDALNADRRRLPMVEVTTDYRFDGPGGEVGLLDLFEGRHQLIVQHVMYGPDWDLPCRSCSAAVDEIARGAEVGNANDLLDLTALGRQEPWEEPTGRTTGLALQAGSPTMPNPDEYPDA